MQLTTKEWELMRASINTIERQLGPDAGRVLIHHIIVIKKLIAQATGRDVREV